MKLPNAVKENTMAIFSIAIDNKYPENSVENSLETYRWIYSSLKNADIIDGDIRSSFLFQVGDILCNCDSYEEFMEYAYGETNYKLIQITLALWNTTRNRTITVRAENDGIRISANNKVFLEKILQELKKETKSSNNTYIGAQYNISEVSGKNVTINQGENITISSDNKESKFKLWIESILQNLLANWLWIVITAIIGFIIGICV